MSKLTIFYPVCQWLSNVFCFFMIFYNFRYLPGIFLCNTTKNPLFWQFGIQFFTFSSQKDVLLSAYCGFVAGATTFSAGFRRRFLYNLYISSAARRVFATISPGVLGKQ